MYVCVGVNTNERRFLFIMWISIFFFALVSSFLGKSTDQFSHGGWRDFIIFFIKINLHLQNLKTHNQHLKLIKLIKLIYYNN